VPSRKWEAPIYFGGSMPENQKEIKVSEIPLPNRKERRHIEKTGKSIGGAEVHPESRENLKKATIGDLKDLASQVNEANVKVLDSINKFYEDVSISFKEVHWNFGLLLSFLYEKGYLKEDALKEFEEFKKAQEKDFISTVLPQIEKIEKAKEEKPKENNIVAFVKPEDPRADIKDGELPPTTE
jgi:hypothetical protein